MPGKDLQDPATWRVPPLCSLKHLHAATKVHDWTVRVLDPLLNLFRTTGHIVQSQHQVTVSAGQLRGDVEIKSYLQDDAGHHSLVFDLYITHDRIGSSCQWPRAAEQFAITSSGP